MNHRFLIALLLALAPIFVGRASAQTYGASYATAIVYTNPGDQTANITFSFRSEANGTVVNDNRTLAAHASGSLNVGSLSMIPAGFHGSVVIRSDRPILATMVQLPPSVIASKTRPVSNGQLGTSSRLVMPGLAKAFQSRTTIVAVQNADSVANDITVTFRSSAGVQVHVATYAALPPGASKYFDLGTIPELGASFDGWAEIVATRGGTTPGRVAATALDLATSTTGVMSKYATSYEGVVPSSASRYVGTAMCAYSSALTTTTHEIINFSSSIANVTTTFSPGGAPSTPQVAGQSASKIDACMAGNPSGSLGTVGFDTDQPIVVLNRTTNDSSAWVVDEEVGDTLVAPYIRWAADASFNVSGGAQRTFLRVQNVGPQATSGPITVEYYDANGNLVETHTSAAPLAPGAVLASNPNLNHPTNTTFSFGFSPPGGGAIIRGPAGSRLAATVQISSYVTYSSERAQETYNAMYLRPPVVADNCNPNPCMNGGTCNPVLNGYTCSCTGTWSGSNCQIAPNACGANPCMNGGTCTASGGSYTCQCPTGYMGTTCETNIDDCTPNPCMNGGTCMDGVASYTCQCAPGYTGTTCATNIDDCTPNPCMNGGACTDGVASYTCQCASGYSGLTCATASLTADFTTITGTDLVAFGGLFVARGLEFNVSSPVTVSSLVVSGLPAGQEQTTILWHKTGAVDLMATNTFALGSPMAPSSTASGSATFTFPSPLVLDVGTHSIVITVEDMSGTGDWSMRQLDNTGQYLTAGTTTFDSVWGWYGDVDTSTNVAANVSIYDNTYFWIPRIALEIAP